MHSKSPKNHVFALDASGLTAPNVTVWTAWVGAEILGVGPLLQLDADNDEVKPMRTHPHHVHKGVASAILKRIIVEARQRGPNKLSLETGTGQLCEPAVSLYLRRGFRESEPFGGYNISPFNQFFQLELEVFDFTKRQSRQACELTATIAGPSS